MENLKRKLDLNEEEQLLNGDDTETTSEDASASSNKRKLGLVAGSANVTDGGTVKVEK